MNQNALIEAVKDRIHAAFGGTSPTKSKSTKYKANEPLMPVTLPRPVYGVLEGLKVKPPEPKVKFYELLETPPFNRAQKEELMVHFLKDYKFFALHPEEILKNTSGRVTI